MLEMLGKMLLPLFICVTIYRFYKHRHQFAVLSKVEWVKYIAGFIFSVSLAVAVIFAGKALVEHYLSGWLANGSNIAVILLVLMLVSAIFERFIPKSLKTLYK